jgi:hypothetical protein
MPDGLFPPVDGDAAMSTLHGPALARRLPPFSAIAGILLTMVALGTGTSAASACAAISFSQVPVVNADQSVILIWDAATHTEHFIRKASFKSAGDELGFIVPTPTQPDLEECSDAAFDYLRKLTAPEIKHQWHLPRVGIGCGMDAAPGSTLSSVQVLEEKEVAGYQAAVLKAGVAGDLVSWLKDNGFAYSPAMEAWAKPYIEQGWKFTALKLAKSKLGKNDKALTAGTLRITFKTEEPLFPYREPDSTEYARRLGTRRRLLRIYFLADARYEGDLRFTKSHWTGKAVWANPLKPAERLKTLELLKLPASTGPLTWWLTEFEDYWPYQEAPSDIYFARAFNQETLKREPIVALAPCPWPGDVTVYALAAVLVGPPVIRRMRRGKAG